MERTDYRHQIQEMLQDQNVYTPIPDRRSSETSLFSF